MGILYLVATPIGNLEDMTFRAIRTLKEVDVVYAEDTRHTLKLWSHFDIRTHLESLHEHNEKQRVEKIVEELKSGRNIALVSDAGTPAISDPGYPLVRACREQGIDVVPIPGACAAVAALSASGLPTDRFVFLGFPPEQQSRRREWLAESAHQRATLIAYLSPHKAAGQLSEMAEIWGDRKAVLCRELTKMYEEFVQSDLRNLAAAFSESEPKGELTLIVQGAVDEPVSVDTAAERASELASGGLSVRDISEQLRLEFGLKRKEAYNMALEAVSKT